MITGVNSPLGLNFTNPTKKTMSQIEFRRKTFITIVVAAVTVIFSNWGSIVYQRQARDNQIVQNTLNIKHQEQSLDKQEKRLDEYDIILNSKISNYYHEKSDENVLRITELNRESIKALEKKFDESNQFLIQNIIDIKNQLIQLNNNNKSN